MTLDGAMVDRRDGEEGFSLVETLVAAMLSLVVAAAVFTLMQPSNGLFASELEAGDMQQRLRVAEGTLARSLLAAGAGVSAGRQTGPLVMYVPPVLPFREGAHGGDPVGTFASDRITILTVPATTAQTVLSQPLAPGDLTFSPAGAQDGGCGVGDPMCGFSPGAQVLVFDESGHYDLFTIAAVNGGIAHLSLNRASNAMTTSYPAGSKVVEVESDTYYLKTDVAARGGQLMHYDGSNNADVPIVDNVVGLRFDYDGDPQPPTMIRPLADVSPPQTTYGAPPRTVSPPFAAGENCLFVNDGSPTPAPRLPALGNGSRSLVALTAAQLTDGPWCPDDANPNRWDADLLRIRKIGVTLRVQAAVAALRGPAGALFVNPGTSSGGSRFVPDLEIRFQISPRNMNPGR
jgi:type II secretory pathway pseudopilin PulG